MVHGVVLAAGRSSRMGAPKAALRLGPEGPTFAASVVRTLFAAGIDRVVVVAGAHAEAVRASVPSLPGVSVLDHPGWESGQLSSLVAALDVVDQPDVDAILVTLVDVPLVRPDTVRVVLDAWRRTRAAVVRPAIGDLHGHPVIFDRATFADLRAAPVAVGAKAVILAWQAQVLNVAVDDPGVLRDVDTPADYAALLERGTERAP
jgi:molybdenum cofactor cytidylyltransferase